MSQIWYNALKKESFIISPKQISNLSDRELARYLSDSNAAKWFCDFNLAEATPDYSVFSKLRAKIGTNLLSKIFSSFRDQLRSQGYMSEVFTFVDQVT